MDFPSDIYKENNCFRCEETRESYVKNGLISDAVHKLLSLNPQMMELFSISPGGPELLKLLAIKEEGTAAEILSFFDEDNAYLHERSKAVQNSILFASSNSAVELSLSCLLIFTVANETIHDHKMNPTVNFQYVSRKLKYL
jgi:hypothetical protein